MNKISFFKCFNGTDFNFETNKNDLIYYVALMAYSLLRCVYKTS